MQSVSKEQILRLGMEDATVEACLNAHKHGLGVTWELALQAMVYYLVEDKKALNGFIRDYENGTRVVVQGRPIEPFVVRHYTGDEHPTIKGNGFDGLVVGDDRVEAEAFVNWLNINLP
jgi:O-acetyl-ADP-ribose deacetylase (regulator of RNase III)